MGGYYDGRLAETNISLKLVPIVFISLKLRWSRKRFKHVGIKNIDRTVSLYTARANIALNAHLQLSGLYQYNTQRDLNALSIRFFWEYKPLSYIYLSWNNRSAFDVPYEESAIFKINYTRQF